MDTSGHFEIDIKQFQVRFYSEEDKDNYFSAFSLYRDGDKGFIYSLCGKGFYKVIGKYIKEIFEKCEINSLEAYVLPDHANLIKQKMNNIMTMTILDKSEVHKGRNMYWIKLEVAK